MYTTTLYTTIDFESRRKPENQDYNIYEGQILDSHILCGMSRCGGKGVRLRPRYCIVSLLWEARHKAQPPRRLSE